MPLIGAPHSGKIATMGKPLSISCCCLKHGVVILCHSPLRLMMLRGSGSLSVTATVYKSSPKKGSSHQNTTQISRWCLVVLEGVRFWWMIPIWALSIGRLEPASSRVPWDSPAEVLHLYLWILRHQSLWRRSASLCFNAWQVGRCEEVQGVQDVLVRCTQEFCKMNQYF